MLKLLRTELQQMADRGKADILSRFFKTGRGEYGEGDVFLGIAVPCQRRLARKYSSLSFPQLRKLLNSRIHEERLTALLILIDQYRRSDSTERDKIVEFYLQNMRRVNNWDLVDLSAGNILGDYLLGKDRAILYELAASDNLWEKRIAIISTFAFIRENQFRDALSIAELLVNDGNDLIHKAVGWMLREIGKRDLKAEERFLKKHYKVMPRTMLRYAIERFDKRKRNYYMT